LRAQHLRLEEIDIGSPVETLPSVGAPHLFSKGVVPLDTIRFKFITSDQPVYSFQVHNFRPASPHCFSTSCFQARRNNFDRYVSIDSSPRCSYYQFRRVDWCFPLNCTTAVLIPLLLDLITRDCIFLTDLTRLPLSFRISQHGILPRLMV
jgi:hypothetical protein